MRFFKDAYLSFGNLGTIVSKEQFISIFDRINLQESDFNRNRYIPGNIGHGTLYKDLLSQSNL